MTKLTGYETKKLFQRRIVISFIYKEGSKKKKKTLIKTWQLKPCNIELEYGHDIFFI